LKTAAPNIVFVLTDDQRFDTIGALGNPHVRTPHLDALAERGTVFTRAHIPGGTHGAVCMPSRAMIHTGRTLFHLEREGQQLPAEHATLAETLRAAGYHTYGIGKWHNGRPAFARGFAGGDEIFFGGMWDHWNVPAYRFDPAGRYAAQLPMVPDFLHSNEVLWRPGDHLTAGRHSTELFLDAALEFLRSYREQRPFFLYLAFLAPHDPRTMPEAFRRLYDPDRLPLPPNFLPEHPIDQGDRRIRDEMLAGFPRTPAEVRRHLAEYYAMISHLDDALGRLCAALEQSGRRDNTLLVLAGDNGLAVGQHGLMGKQNLYDHSVRVPLLLAGPGVPRAERREALVYLLDLFPTLCELAGFPIPATVEGRSLTPCLEGRGGGREELYLAYASHIRGVTDGRRKLIEYACGATQLFDLAADPWETRNLAGEAGRQAELAELRQRLRRLAAAWDDEQHPTGQAFWAQRPDLKAAPA